MTRVRHSPVPTATPRLTRDNWDRQYLNIGCGMRSHPDWLNVDLHARQAGVIEHDVLAGPLPFADDSMDVVYHAHLLEHLPLGQAPAFLGECRRLLRRGGVLRVVVPDLEGIVRLYLQALDKSLAGDGDWQRRYRWLVLEMYDQVQRQAPGGAMLDYLRRQPGDDFAWGRLGADARLIRAHWQAAPPAAPLSWRTRLTRELRAWCSPSSWREHLLRRLLGPEYALLQVARFRRGGEIHQWMYDRFSLGQLLRDAGFVEVRQVEAAESRIAAWRSFHLDTEPDGCPAKPDSLYMEAVKP